MCRSKSRYTARTAVVPQQVCVCEEPLGLNMLPWISPLMFHFFVIFLFTLLYTNSFLFILLFLMSFGYSSRGVWFSHAGTPFDLKLPLTLPFLQMSWGRGLWSVFKVASCFGFHICILVWKLQYEVVIYSHIVTLCIVRFMPVLLFCFSCMHAHVWIFSCCRLGLVF